MLKMVNFIYGIKKMKSKVKICGFNIIFHLHYWCLFEYSKEWYLAFNSKYLGSNCFKYIKILFFTINIWGKDDNIFCESKR